MTNKLAPVHPGEILLEEFLRPMNLSEEQLAADISVPVAAIQGIVRGEQNLTADLALRLARYFDMSPQFWLGLQMDYELDVVADQLADRLPREVKRYVA